MFPFAFDMSHARRWGAMTLATLALHLVALNWADQQLSRPAPVPRPNETVQIRLRAAKVTPTPPVEPVALVQSTPTEKPAPRPVRKKTAASAPSAATTPAAATPAAEPAAPALAQLIEAPSAAPVTSTPEPALPAASATPEPTPIPATPPPLATPPGKILRLNMPPSMELKYKVRKAKKLDDSNGLTEGSGTIRWQNMGQQYRINTAAKILFLTLFSSQSEGEITGSGIAPLLYTKTTPKATTNTHFQRARNVISFSASTREYPRTEAAQDQSSMIFQLAGIGLGNSEQISDGNLIEFVVASHRDAEPWQFQVLGMEKMQLENKEALTWHLQRAPAAGSFSSKFDIWLSPAHHWAPVHIMQTDSDGGVTEMTMTKFTLTESEQK